MFIIPVLLFFGGLVGLSMMAKGLPTGEVKSREQIRGVFQTQRPALHRLLNILRLRREPDQWAIDDAIVEAYDLGDWKMFSKLRLRFMGEDAGGDEGETPFDEEVDQPDEEGGQEENEPPDNPIGPEGSEIVIGRNSPFDGVPNEAWDRFVSSLETQKEDYQGPKHVGKYHHSRERLANLKIDDVGDGEKQYQALVTDLVDAREKCRDLIREFEFQAITLEGGEQVATLSGILAVIKSAGMEHARSWFVNPDDRKKFPKTTEMFSKANGAF